MDRHPPIATPKYEAWLAAETKAVHAQRMMRQMRAQARTDVTAADPQMPDRVAELERLASSLFEQAMDEMHSAVAAALARTHSRHH